MKSRDTTKKRIGRAGTIAEKLDVATGKRRAISKLENDLDVAAIVDRANWLATASVKPETFAYHATKIGCALVWAIVNGKHGVIQKLAAKVQFPQSPKDSPLHRDILCFCECLDCGTELAPAPSRALVEYLRNRGHKFSVNHAGDIPRFLVTTCEKIGVWLVNK